MNRTARITRLMPDACEQIQARMLEACRKIAADHGLIVESAGWRGLDPGLAFEPVFRVSIPASDGTAPVRGPARDVLRRSRGSDASRVRVHAARRRRHRHSRRDCGHGSLLLAAFHPAGFFDTFSLRRWTTEPKKRLYSARHALTRRPVVPAGALSAVGASRVRSP